MSAKSNMAARPDNRKRQKSVMLLESEYNDLQELQFSLWKKTGYKVSYKDIVYKLIKDELQSLKGSTKGLQFNLEELYPGIPGSFAIFRHSREAVCGAVV